MNRRTFIQTAGAAAAVAATTPQLQAADKNRKRANKGLIFKSTKFGGRPNIKRMQELKALGFDGNGDPIAVSLAGAMAAPDFTPSGFGAITRSSDDKMGDVTSIKDFGAVGDGLTDDTNAIINALGAADAVFIPEGTYLISGTIQLTARQSITGVGQSSVLKANSNAFNPIEVTEDHCALSNIRIEGGDVGRWRRGWPL